MTHEETFVTPYSNIYVENVVILFNTIIQIT